MKKLTVIVLALSALFLGACHSNEPSVSSRVAKKVDQFNTENAKAIEKHIKTPIDKARATMNLGEQRTEDINRALQNQTGE